MKLQKIIFCIVLLFMVSACARPQITVPKSRYSSDDLAKHWRSNVENSPKPYNYGSPYGNQYAYPMDNDADYVSPIYKYKPPQPPRQPQPTYQPPAQPTYNAPYPQDNDANYSTSYPTYDPDADNSGYYYINKDKTLPPKHEPTSDPDDYSYPIYFD